LAPALEQLLVTSPTEDDRFSPYTGFQPFLEPLRPGEQPDPPPRVVPVEGAPAEVVVEVAGGCHHVRGQRDRLDQLRIGDVDLDTAADFLLPFGEGRGEVRLTE